MHLNLFYLSSQLAHESLAEWKSPLFAQVFHQSGMAYLKSSLFETDLDVSNMASDLGRTFKDVGKYGDDSKVRFLADGDAVKEACNISAATDVSSLSGWIDGNNGWANAAGGLKVVAEEARKLGVRFESGPRATMRELLRNEDGVAYGVVAKDGTEWKADKVLLATGGWSDSLLDFEGQLLVSVSHVLPTGFVLTAILLQSGGYSITHIDLTQEEADRYRDM